MPKIPVWARRGGAISVVLLILTFFAPGVANALVVAGASSTFPTMVTVGQTGLPASLSLSNLNTPPNTGDTNTVCNTGEASPPCSTPERGIVLVPSCSQIASGQCTPAGADPGVFQLSPTAAGRPGTACAGMGFTIALIDPTFGTVRFTPQPPGAHVTLPGFGATCTIDFTFDVLKSPADQDPPVPGNQTAQTTEHTQFAGPFGPGAPSNFARFASNGITVLAAQPSITTTASPDIVLGAGTLTDNATVSGRVDPQPVATITYTLFGPDNTTCTGAPIFTSTVPYPVAGGAVTSAAFTPTSAGTYRWVASYSGDVNNNPVAGPCNAANETTVVAPVTPTIATNASPNIVLGGVGTLTDVATVSGRVNPQAGATIIFRLFGPGDVTCTGAPVFAPAPVPYPVAGGPVSSPAFTPTQAGTYRWIAAYSGDVNNAAVTGACNTANETTVVAPATPTIATNTSPNIVLGAGTLTDNATVSGRVNPQAGATIAFQLFGPNDATCAGTPAFTSTVPYPVAGGPVTSAAFTPASAGTYRWIATYSGDANNAPVSAACNDPAETVAVALATPTIATTASPDITLGAGPLTDTAVVSGRVNPLAGATLNFRLYGPGDATCGGPPIFQNLNVPYPVAGGPVTSATFTPTSAGTYRWVAAYSGDANNAPVSGACNAADETTVVNRATPTIAGTASPNIALGATITDTVTVSGRVDPQAGATITFNLFGPNDATCTGSAAFTSTVPYPVAGGPVTSAAFTPTQAGTYRWIAVYSGDVTNTPVSGACNAANQSVVVSLATPVIATTASAGFVLGAGTLSDSATVTGRVNQVAGATVDFRLYGPDNATCTGTPVFASLSVPYSVAGGAVTSSAFTPTQAGTYRWIASYSGDSNNAAAAGACNAANESAVVARVTPTIATTASAGIVLGSGTLTDTATVTGRINPLAGATVDFRLFGPNDATCTGTVVFQSLNVPYAVAGGAVTSTAFTPTQAGTYRWIASYSGDANNAPVAGACDAANETVTVSAVTATTTTSTSTTTPASTTTTTTTRPGGAVDADTLRRGGETLPRTGSGPGLIYLGIGLVIGGLLLAGPSLRHNHPGSR